MVSSPGSKGVVGIRRAVCTSHGTKVYFVKQLQVRDKGADDNSSTHLIPMMREYTVFNVDQCESLPDSIKTGKPMRVRNPDTRDEVAYAFLRSTGADIREGHGEAELDLAQVEADGDIDIDGVDWSSAEPVIGPHSRDPLSRNDGICAFRTHLFMKFESGRRTTVGVGLADRGRRLLGNIPHRRFCMEIWPQAVRLAIVCCFLVWLPVAISV